MITDGRGNVIAGGNNGGKSHISYKPYGEIHRTDSSGPDITRFKYTGQEEDKESGLMYYKARYYDPMIGRFLQADSVVMPQSTFGMNRYMYVEGNPVRYGDDSGHIHHNGKLEKQINSLAAAVVIAKDPNVSTLNAVALGITVAGGNKYHLADEIALGRIVENIPNWFRWLSGGLQRAADTVNLYTGRANHKPGERGYARSDIGRSDLGRSDFKRFYKAMFDYSDLGASILKGDRDAATKNLNRNDIVRAVKRNKECVKVGVDIALLFIPGGVVWDLANDAATLAGAGKAAAEAFATDTKNLIGIVGMLNDARSCDFKSF